MKAQAVTFTFSPDAYDGEIRTVGLLGTFLFYESGLTGHSCETGMGDNQTFFNPHQYREGLEFIGMRYYEEMRREEDGAYRLSFDLPAGMYAYRFAVNAVIEDELPDFRSGKQMAVCADGKLHGFSKETVYLTDPERPPLIPTATGRQEDSILCVGDWNDYLLLQKSYTADFLSHKRVKNDGRLPQYYVENAHEPVVPREVFYRVQGEISSRKDEVNSPGNDRRNAFSGKVYGGGTAYRRFAGTERYPETIWRCREKGGGRAVLERELEDAVVAAFNRLPEFHDDLVRMEERIQWGPMDRISREIESADERTKELENAINDYAASGILESNLLYLYGDGTESVEAAIDGIKAEMDSLAAMKTDLLTQKGALAVQEAQIHSLLRMTQAVEGKKEEKPEPESPACYTLSDFYDRTDDIGTTGRILKFDKQLVRRFVERIEVRDTGFTVTFKAWISVEVDG